jgi:long-chain acyl-CoA synthetase
MPMPGVEVQISPEGEILLKGEGIFTNYCGEQESSSPVQDGWLHTGDLGRVDSDGHLIVTDRCDSIIKLADGRLIAPQSIESSIRFSPYIKEAVVIGRGMDFLSALVCIDGKVVGKWAGDCKLGYTTYSDLASKPEVYDLISRELERTVQGFPENTRIKRFTILYKDLDPDDGEIARVGKVRRKIVEERFRELVDALYCGDESMQIDKNIELGDGTVDRVQSTVYFRNLN